MDPTTREEIAKEATTVLAKSFQSEDDGDDTQTFSEMVEIVLNVVSKFLPTKKGFHRKTEEAKPAQRTGYTCFTIHTGKFKGLGEDEDYLLSDKTFTLGDKASEKIKKHDEKGHLKGFEQGEEFSLRELWEHPALASMSSNTRSGCVWNCFLTDEQREEFSKMLQEHYKDHTPKRQASATGDGKRRKKSPSKRAPRRNPYNSNILMVKAISKIKASGKESATPASELLDRIAEQMPDSAKKGNNVMNLKKYLVKLLEKNDDYSAFTKKWDERAKEIQNKTDKETIDPMVVEFTSEVEVLIDELSEEDTTEEAIASVIEASPLGSKKEKATKATKSKKVAEEAPEASGEETNHESENEAAAPSPPKRTRKTRGKAKEPEPKKEPEPAPESEQEEEEVEVKPKARGGRSNRGRRTRA